MSATASAQQMLSEARPFYSTQSHTWYPKKDAQRTEGITYTHGSMVKVSALGLVLLVSYSVRTAHVFRGKPGQQSKVEWTQSYPCLVHTIHDIISQHI